jgi:hypothetical protein
VDSEREADRAGAGAVPHPPSLLLLQLGESGERGDQWWDYASVIGLVNVTPNHVQVGCDPMGKARTRKPLLLCSFPGSGLALVHRQ